jgi:hypothetical protein
VHTAASDLAPPFYWPRQPDHRALNRAKHLPELDGVRGAAIAMVMALHFVNNGITPTNLLERAAVKVTNYGLWGVDLFFVLSGFLITGILVESKNARGYFRNFFVRRALRIFPLYYGTLLILLALASTASLVALEPELLELRDLSPWLWPYLTNVYLGPHTDFSIPYVSHFWSLAIEEHFYLVWPFAIWFLPHRAAMRACVVLGAVALLLRIAFATFAPDQLYASVLTPTRIDSLCAGAWFALAARDGFPLPTGRAALVAWVAGGTIVLLSAWNFTFDSGAISSRDAPARLAASSREVQLRSVRLPRHRGLRHASLRGVRVLRLPHQRSHVERADADYLRRRNIVRAGADQLSPVRIAVSVAQEILRVQGAPGSSARGPSRTARDDPRRRPRSVK